MTDYAAEDATRATALREAPRPDEVYVVKPWGRDPVLFGHADDAIAYASARGGCLTPRAVRVLDHADARRLIEQEEGRGMADVTIYGASDDLIEVEGDVPGCDEYNRESAVFILRGSGEVSGGVTRVTVEYGAGGCWMIGVAPVDEDVSMLPMTMGQQPRTRPDAPGYSARATFTGVEAVELLDADSFE